MGDIKIYILFFLQRFVYSLSNIIKTIGYKLNTYSYKIGDTRQIVINNHPIYNEEKRKLREVQTLFKVN